MWACGWVYVGAYLWVCACLRVANLVDEQHHFVETFEVMMAQRALLRVLYDLRRADVEAGGHGAPLCASYHGALLERIGAGEETAVLNLGGVANLSWKSTSGRIIAFDTGPANAPINDWVKGLGLGDMDRDGALAAGAKR